ncbi:SEC-C metal-binding domain-containing protein [Leuconostoc fallax]|uniref:SEC-C metal-binding domain-containing protein n=1 Tax=Leuconostoc fallax TaxID=1251 RepID=UPI00209034A9|nr:SEC-C metal-binding domain-containing protein [Leuconostoc fallax]MCO6183795.1 SEC-C metal-binding domain-containing protein [Leuconostoc fallax]
MIDYLEVENKFVEINGIKLNSCFDSGNAIIVSVTFDASALVNNARFILDHTVQIEIPKKYPLDLPSTFEFPEKTITNFPHLNHDTNRTFCLGIELDIRKKMEPDYSFETYVSLIADFLGMYQYYSRYQIFPYGERSHGDTGIREYYKELFSVDTDRQIMNLMKTNKLNNSMRNKKCPCNSGLKLKNCHWSQLNIILSNSLQHVQLQKDYKILQRRL